MRVRKLVTLFWALCMVVFFVSVYYFTERILKTPPRASVNEEMKDNKWLRFEDKLKHLESEVNEYHAVVGELKSAVQELLPAAKSKQAVESFERVVNVLESVDFHDESVVESVPRQCPLRLNTIPNTDIQMLDVYEKTKFDNLNGGPWTQGWQISSDPHQWNPYHKLKVFIVPHSHNDPGWLKTFEEYYLTQTHLILNNVLAMLSEDTRRKFVWAEISYFSLWWKDITPQERTRAKKLIQSKQLEIVTGGWVMNDEATSHWISIVQQLTTGHQWLKEHLDIVPKSGWAIDPFGHSATQPYLLKSMGINGSLIQRVHYRVKKELARNKQLEFRWRQTWDSLGSTDMWTHMMPFYSYDIPHSCGPDPKICCQFDFKRLPGYGVTCPWKIPPRQINKGNVKERAELLLDQWQKKAQLYKSRVLLFPLGDDFRWDQKVEWDAQFNNYDKIIDYLNSNENLHVEVRYGTLSDYFNAVMAEKSNKDFPVLSGDFFTYADRDDHYWSGYYTSRPFYKRMDRVLMAYVRSTEIMLTLARARSTSEVPNILLSPESKMTTFLEKARQSLSLFQHHDGVTGTARDPVVIDYGKKLLQAIEDCRYILQQSVYHLLVEPTYFHPMNERHYFDIDDVRRDFNTLPEKIVTTIGSEAPSRKIVLYNSLPFLRTEVVTLHVSTGFVIVLDSDNLPVECQISPVILSNTKILDNQFQLSFVAKIPALGLNSYVVTAVERTSLTRSSTFATVKFLNYDGVEIDGGLFETSTVSPKHAGDFVLTRTKGNGVTAAFSKDGLLKAIKLPNKSTYPVHLNFRKYGTRHSGDKSGGYLFLPDSNSTILENSYNLPIVTLIQGPIISKMSVQYPYVTQHTVTLYDESDNFIEVTNLVDVIDSHNMELVMRLSTNIDNKNEFYTDLNGLQMIKRKYFSKLPLQANFYPMPSAAYIEDEKKRLTILTSTSLGMAALSPGQLEVMQDRRLDQDDNRGLAQGILDNHPTQHIFRILIETKESAKCENVAHDHPSGFLTVAAHVSSETLINPIITLLYNGDGHPERSEPEWLHGKNLNYNYEPMSEEPGVDINIASYRDNVVATIPGGKTKRGRGLVIHRQQFDTCFNNVEKKYSLSGGQLKLNNILPLSEVDEVRNSSLSFLHVGPQINLNSAQNICPMDILSYFIYD